MPPELTPEEVAYVTRLLIQSSDLRGLYINNIKFHVAVDELVRSLPGQVQLIRNAAKEGLMCDDS